MELDRRNFLLRASAATLPFLYLARQGLPLRADDTGKGGKKNGPGAAKLIVREKNPVNLEFPFNTLNSFLTPNDLFYVRNHFAMPTLDKRTWRLRVEGAVRKTLNLTYEALLRFPSRTRAVTLECAGNSRSYLTPKVGGVPWQLGAVSTAEWTGVPLALVLAKAGLKEGAVDVVLEGADKGDVTVPQRPKGQIHFARSLPLAKAKKPEVLLAFKMNGKPLPPEHGFPVRVLVPGWYGVASIKWLRRIVVTDRPSGGFFQTIDYSYWERRHGLPVLTPITDMQLRSVIARPAAGEEVPAGKDYTVHGAAWGPGAEITKVEVSVDGGKHWAPAALEGKHVPFAWRLWKYTWRKPAAGKYTLLVRAEDKEGRKQATERDPDRRNYMISHILPVDVTVA
jgi:DMSO/TMAO reductase YedYZ molybdopterin-dependent catalytic subunit